MSPKAQLLLIDDQPANLNTLARALADEYELSIATSGASGLALAKDLSPDLILLDVIMPEMDGLETLRRLRQSDWGRETPVILVTADDRAETQVSGLALGADDFIATPVIVPVVQARVRNVLEHRFFARALAAINGNLARLSGGDFHRGVGRLLTETLGTHYACVGLLHEDANSVTVIDGWADGQPITPFTYELAGTPCAEVMNEGVACYPKAARSLFPRDPLLVDMGIETYVGATLFDKQGRPLGILITLGRHPLGSHFARLAPSLLRLFIDRVASEIQRSAAEQRTQRQLAFQRIAAGAATELAAASTDAEIDVALDQCLERLGHLFEVDRGYIFRFSDDLSHARNTHEWCAAGVTPRIKPLQDCPVDTLPWWKEQLLSAGLTSISRVGDLPPEAAAERAECQRQGIQSLVTMALYGTRGALTGFIGFDSVRGARAWSAEELVMLQTVAGIVGAAIERKQAEDQLKQAASVFEHANEGIMITDPAGVILDVNAAFTRITGYRREEVLGQNPRILRSGRQDAAFYAEMWQSLQSRGSWAGEVWNRRKSGEVFAELLAISAVRDPDGRVQRYVALFSDISAQKAHQRQLEYIAHHDALTGLPNRVLLADRLRQAMAQAARRGQQLAVAYLDLDGFKTINDNWGHDAGDRLLVAMAHRMRHAMREGDTLARPGGDEFVAVWVDLPDVATCLPLLNRLREAVAAPLHDETGTLKVSVSLGVSVYPQAEPIDADQLLRQADQAMYQAKLAGKNRYHLFDAAHDRDLRGRHESLERLREALANREFVLHYQPKVNLRQGHVIGAEALLRWRHPERGLLFPDAFLPVLENHALMIELGDWVIETALAQNATWRAAGWTLPVSVNVDPLQLEQADFIDKLRAALARHPTARPGDVELEVVETSALEGMNRISEMIDACRALGIRFSLDDFGTGYSSLTYLKRLPVETLKIDQSFVRDMLDDPDDLAILEGVIGLADAFQRAVIAEGVESEMHGEMLLRLGCELGQGYAIARPMSAARIPAWLARWRPPVSWGATARIARKARPVLLAMVEHRAWVRALYRYLNDQKAHPPLVDSHHCKLGRWLDATAEAGETAHPAYADIVPLHDGFHRTAAELIELKQRGGGALALARFGEIETLRENLLEALGRLIV
ncbi:MAG: EAL domain-containing protein [Candidatus Contendobacter sp.]|nr:EAL domain-containing protein [Candidatus Contendobacter sp.]MDS4057037.1 EAL domain-containing protein [Candidatus Contendobacter sp.]